MVEASIDNINASVNTVALIVPVTPLGNLIPTHSLYRVKPKILSGVSINRKYDGTSSSKGLNDGGDNNKGFIWTWFISQQAMTPC